MTLAKNWWLIGCDTIPIFEYPHNTWLWVGLSWKFMCLSMGSLWTHVIGVMLEAASVVEKWCELKVNCTAKPCAVPGLTVGFHREAKLMGRGAYTRVCKWKVNGWWSAYWVTIIRGFIPDGCNQMLWHKCATSAECKPIRIAASADMDNWKGHSVSVIRNYIFVTGGFWTGAVTWFLNHNWVVGMTLMFPLELVSTWGVVYKSVYEIKLALCN